VTGEGETKDLLQEVEALQQRAYELRLQLGGRLQAEPLPPGEMRVLVCRAAEYRIAFLEQIVQEVVMVPHLVPLPEAPCWVPGLLNLRGQILPVIDVAARLTRGPREILLDDMIVVSEVEGRQTGFLVQDVLGLRTVPADAVQRPNRDVACAPYLLGVVSHDEDSFALLSGVLLVRMSDLPAGDLE
jgi:chemotaxis signal transduction protein